MITDQTGQEKNSKKKFTRREMPFNNFVSQPAKILGGALVERLVRRTPDRAARVQARALGTTLCS